jgi:hypothetical protein
MHDKVTVRTRICIPIYSNCDNVKLQNDSVTLIFEVGTWFLNATNRLDVVDIWAKLFQNPSMYDKVTVRTWMKWGRTDGRTDRRCDNIMPPFGGIKIYSDLYHSYLIHAFRISFLFQVSTIWPIVLEKLDITLF